MDPGYSTPGAPGRKETREWARRYLRHGLAVIPVPRGSKNPGRANWQKERWGLEHVDEQWSDGEGVSVLWGSPSGNLVDLDLDWRESCIAAARFLPPTRTFGRPGSPESHRIYRIVGDLPKNKKFSLSGKGPGRTVTEVLSTGNQSLVPPSLHESGELRRWYSDRPAAQIDAETLMEGAADAASAGYIARSWPGQGVRHDYVNACAGYLGRHLPRPRAQRIMDAAIYAAGVTGADEESDRRYAPVRSTLDKLERGEPVTGWQRLEDVVPAVGEQLRRWHAWSAKRGDEGEANGTSSEANGKVNPDAGLVKVLTDAICEKDHFARDPGDKLYRFSGGTYRHFGERFIRGRVKRLLEDWSLTKRWSSHVANEVVHYITADCPELWDRPPDDSINVANGILQIRSGELREHDPGYLSPVQIPARFDSQADCPAWDRFIDEVFPEDATELAYELAAALMCPGGSSQQSILLLGEGSNGKSTFLRALTAFIGSTNAAGVSLHKLESDRFATARLVGKLANICPDLPSTHLSETSVFKAITGGDMLLAEYKYKDSFEFDPFCRLVFSANHVPRSEDASHAFFRRWAVVPFDRTFESNEQTPREQLDATLSDPDELSGVLNRALLALPRVRREGFTESKSMRKAWKEFKEMTDPVSVWLKHHTIEHSGASVPKGALHNAYNRYCEQKGRAGMTSKAFTRALLKARPKLGEAQLTVSDRRVWCWIGIGLTQEEGMGDDDHGG